jgi:hypothetical protein
MADVTAGDLLRRVLSGAGVRVAYGTPTSGVPVIGVSDPEVALTLAIAHRAVRGPTAAAMLEGGIVRVPGSEAGEPARLVISDAADLLDATPHVGRGSAGSGLEMRLDLDLDRPAPDLPPSGWVEPRWSEPDPVARDRLDRASSVVVLAGPGVVTRGAVTALHAFASAGRLGVINTWGAKGMFHWSSRHHWATAGLQDQDFALAGLDRAELVIAVGVDEREAPSRFWRQYPHLVVDPDQLGPLAERWRGPSGWLDLPPLRIRLAGVTQAGWSSGSKPVMPTRVTMHYGQSLAAGGLVAADAGNAGYWVARTFATTELRAACVPPATTPGWAAACVLVSRIADPLRPALAVLSGALDDHTRSVIDVASGLGIAVGVEVWSPDGETIGPDEHLARLGTLTDSRVGGVVSLATDEHQIDEMVEAAGEVRAWRDGD